MTLDERSRGERTLQQAKLWAFAATGWSLPLYAFPVVTVFGRPIDLATILAAAAVAICAPAILARSLPRGARFFGAGAVLVPLLALTPLGPLSLTPGPFAFSYAHWILVVAFFIAAQTLRLSAHQKDWFVGSQVLVGCATALFALYQVVGIPLQWPATGSVLLPFQREPMRFDVAPGYVRPTATFLEPGWLGSYLAWVLVLAVALLLVRGARRSSGAARFAAIVVLLLALFATVSWGAYADLAAGLAVGALTLRKNAWIRRHRLAPLGAAVLVAILFVLVTSPGRHVVAAVGSRLAALIHTPLRPEAPKLEIRDTSWVRYQNLRHVRDLFVAYPLGGVGLGQLAYHARSESSPGSRFVDPWCGWVAIAAQMGVLGPVLLVAAFVVVGRRWHRLLPNRALRLAVPAVLGVAAVMQLHTGSYIDLWWWYPMSLAAAATAGDKSAVS